MKTTKLLLVSLGCAIVSFQAQAQLVVRIMNLPKMFAQQNSSTATLADGVIATWASHPGAKNADPADYSKFSTGINMGTSNLLYRVRLLGDTFLPGRGDASYSLYGYSSPSTITKMCEIDIKDDGNAGSARPYPYYTGYCQVNCVKGTTGTPSGRDEYQVRFDHIWRSTHVQGQKC